MLTKPAVARKKFTFISELNTDTFKIIAGSAIELVDATITAGGAACTFRLLDLPNGGGFTPGQAPPGYNIKDGMGLATESSNSFEYKPNQPTPFFKGLIIVCEQGEGSNAEITITYNAQ